jgi:hypothetical protein
MTPPKQPPPGVETTPQGPVVPLSEAAAWLGKDPRTLIKAIKAGTLRGGATPRAQRLRWYVYAEELAPLSEAVAAAAPAPDSYVDELRAQNVSLMEANRLLIAAQQDLLDADRTSHDAAEKYRAVARRYLDALAQFMTPGNIGELAGDR